MLASIRILRDERPDVHFNRGLLGYAKGGREMSEKFASVFSVMEFSVNFEEEVLRFLLPLRDYAPVDARRKFEEVVRENQEQVEGATPPSYVLAVML